MFCSTCLVQILFCFDIERISSVSQDGWDFLTNFPSLSKAYSSSEDKEECQKLHDGGIVTLLAAGTKTGKHGEKYCCLNLANSFVP